MDNNIQQFQETWDAFLKEWPLERLRRMALPEYSTAGQSHTFTAWIENRLDKIGSIWGGSAFKFGIYSRKDKTPKSGGGGDSYTQDYAWYSKYGTTPEEAFAKVKSLVVQVAEASARGDYAVDLGDAYKWKIAFHYQDRKNPGVVAVFKPKRLQAWLKGRVGTVPQRTSELYRLILSLQKDKDLMVVSKEVWEETFAVEPPHVSNTKEEPPDTDGFEDLPRNLILYGPPGTGKTYMTAELAVNICDGVMPDGREALMARYRELRNLRRIRFVTFHPSFSYEEFVEGIRPATTEDGLVRYDVRPGVFKQAATYARELFDKREAPMVPLDLKGRKLFKMSLGDKNLLEEKWIYPDCIENDYVCLGFARGVDFAGCDSLQAIRERYKAQKPSGEETDYGMAAVNYLKNELHERDLVLISYGNTRFRAVAEVTGPYYFQAREAGYEHRRPVRWLWWTEDNLPLESVFSKNLSQRTIYLMDQGAVDWTALQELLAPKRALGQAPNCVLVIDEINRANLAKTFGELITLLEPSKRLGQLDEQETELPYSGDRLGVPPNLYVIGTMNTADRSIALMDTALRRRFSFREMPPRPELLEQDIEGIDLQALLEAMNLRIESLFDRDHVLGHTYLMSVTSFEELVQRFRDQIIPLLQEYFFEDWRRIQQVFNDVEHPPEQQIIQSLDLADGGTFVRDRRQRFRVNPTISPAAIQKIYT
jgi:5-methylcytosine-specific restriction protein B